VDDLMGKVDEEGEHYIRDIHNRCKGIRPNALVDKADEDYNGDLFKMYMHMNTKKDGEKIEFDMTSKGKYPYFETVLYESVRTDKPSKRSI